MTTIERLQHLTGEERVKYVQRRIHEICDESHIPEIDPGPIDGVKGKKTQFAIRRMKRCFGVQAKNNNVSLDNGFIENLHSPFNKRFMNAPGQWARGASYRVELRALHAKRLRDHAKAVRQGGVVGIAKASAHADSTGKRKSFYSQRGAWTVNYAVKGEPWGYRSDCSQWFTSCYKSAGRPDPNGLGYSGGYTGTLGSHGVQISREEAMHTPGAAVLFGPWPHHHVEMAVGDGTINTIGHGSTHVDYGTFDLLTGPKTYRRYP